MTTTPPSHQRKPAWLKIKAPGGERYTFVKNKLKTLDLHTVCQSARCPNMAECWGGGTATIMILGDVCTRGCRFCAVSTGHPGGKTDPGEPDHVASCVKELNLDYVVLTSVDRDDLDDGGAAHFAAVISAIKRERPQTLVEVLTPDFFGRRELLQQVVDARPEVLAHNVETVERLSPAARDQRAGYAKSLEVLKLYKELAPEGLTKSSIMVGLGETDAEIRQTMKDLRAVQTDIVTLGQYLQPTPRHLKVERYVSPEEFARYEAEAKELGFSYVASGPLVRSSYRAGELYVKGVLQGKG